MRIALNILYAVAVYIGLGFCLYLLTQYLAVRNKHFIGYRCDDANEILIIILLWWVCAPLLIKDWFILVPGKKLEKLNKRYRAYLRQKYEREK